MGPEGRSSDRNSDVVTALISLDVDCIAHGEILMESSHNRTRCDGFGYRRYIWRPTTQDSALMAARMSVPGVRAEVDPARCDFR